MRRESCNYTDAITLRAFSEAVDDIHLGVNKNTPGRNVHSQLWNKRIIEGAIVVLALFVVAFTSYLTWQAYDRYRNIRGVSHYVDLIDVAMRTITTAALERGLTAATIGGRRLNDTSLRNRLTETRRETDRLWNALSARVETAPDAAYFKEALVEARAARHVFEAAREQAVLEVGNGAVAPGLAKWMEDSTRFIGACMRLGGLAVQAADLRSTTIEFNSVPIALLWEVIEQAGQERAVLAHFIAARLPVTSADRERLTILQSHTEYDLNQVIQRFNAPGTDPRIARAVSAMQENYLGRFKSLRVPVHAAIRAGNYPLNALEWIAQISDAIGSIQAVFDAITVVTRDQAEQARRATMLGFAAGLLLFALSLGLVVLSLTRVRILVDDVFRQKERAEVTMSSIGDAVITTDAEARIEYLNPVAEQLTGWSNAETRGRPLVEVFNIVNGYNRESKESPVDHCLRENQVVGLGNDTVLIRRDGSETVIEDSAAPIRDQEGEVVGAVMVFYDVASQRGNTHLLSYHATHDRLTGLVNRVEFERRLKRALEQARSRGEEHALCYFDLDQFKVVNDTCGHAAGDQLLRALTKQLLTRARDTDTLAHLGGDEFALLLVSCPLSKAVAVAEELLQLVRRFRFEWRGSVFDITASIGVVSITAGDTSADEVLAKADAACFAAKEKGRNRLQLYEPDNLEFARRYGEMQWVSRLTQALEQDRLRLYCQPIVPLHLRQAMHYEILVRLEDESGKIVMPSEFIPAAERYNLMPQIDRWVVHRTLSALRRLRQGRRARGSQAVCNINLSGISLAEPSMLDVLKAELAAASLPPGSVCFEITETAAIANLEQATKLISELKARGCSFALDDFGTGLSSFSYLREMKVDFLKIAGEFVREIAHSSGARTTVKAINTIGHSLNMRTVAEFVSSPSILARVRDIGVDYVQGFAIAKPVPIEECMRKHYTVPRLRAVKN